MPVTLQSDQPFPLNDQEIDRLWRATIVFKQHRDDDVTVRCVDEEESRRLNMEYRKKVAPTNVLTFSYGERKHDIALCLSVAQREAGERGADVRDYVALLLVHAFLHATGMDHERSTEEVKTTARAEREILGKAGFSPLNL